MPISIAKQSIGKVCDRVWSVPATISECQEQIETREKNSLPFHVRALANDDNLSCYANATLQCMIHCSSIREAMLEDCGAISIMQSFVRAYMSDNRDVNVFAVRRIAGEEFIAKGQQNPTIFFISLCETILALKNVVQHQMSCVSSCCACGSRITTVSPSNIISVTVPKPRKVAMDPQYIINHNVEKSLRTERLCTVCHTPSVVDKFEFSSLKTVLVIHLLIFTITNSKMEKKNVILKRFRLQ